MSIISDSIHVARTRKCCDQCLGRIEPGQRYRKQVHTFDGFCAYKAHVGCDEAANRLRVVSGEWRDPYEGGPLLHTDISHEDHEWFAEEFPALAADIFRWAWPPYAEGDQP